jgi:hypothetical protein
MVTTEIKYVPCLEKDWYKLPLKLRQRWWDETDYSKKKPSPELEKAIEEALNDRNH